MPNISFDIFFDDDILNITASRGKVPKIKPEWKVRTAPKLPKPDLPDKRVAAFGSNSSITNKPNTTQPALTAGSVAEDAPKKQIPKLGKPKSAQPTEATKTN